MLHSMHSLARATFSREISPQYALPANARNTIGFDIHVAYNTLHQVAISHLWVMADARRADD